MDRQQLLEVLPQREPMLMVDDILELVPGRRALGYKQVREDEIWMKGHFPGDPVFPGVLLIENMAQVALFLASLQTEKQGIRPYLAKVEQIKFLRPVLPGDSLYTNVECAAAGGGFLKVRAVVSLDRAGEKPAAKGTLTCYLGVDME